MYKIKEIDFYIVTHPHMELWKYNNMYNILKEKGLDHKLAKSDTPTSREIFDTP